MTDESMILVATAAATGLVHTLIGPDHYLPFIMMSRARGWRLGRTLAVTLLCGVGHVASSVLLGLVGVVAGVALTSLTGLESARGQIAAWALIAFGIGYALWGLWRVRTARRHAHPHVHKFGRTHLHEHNHTGEHSHVHQSPGRTLTPWVLFVIFVLGPCEPLIPLFMYPAAQRNAALLLTVTAAFSVATIGTMGVVVALSAMGLRQVRLGWAERYVHVIAGAVIAASGLAIQAFGL